MGKKKAEELKVYEFETEDEKVTVLKTPSNSTGEKLVADIEIKTPIEGYEDTGFHWSYEVYVDHLDRDPKVEPKEGVEFHDRNHEEVK